MAELSKHTAIANPECVAHHQSTHKVREVKPCALLAFGVGRMGFLFEMDIYVFWEEEECIQFYLYRPPGADPWSYFSEKPSAIAFGLGTCFRGG